MRGNSARHQPRPVPGDHPELLEGRRVFIIPEANPDRPHASARENARGVDLNRNFPAANYRGGRGHGSTPLSEPESRALRDLITEYEPDRIISLHQPLTCIDYDGPGEALACAMAAACDLPLKKLGGRDGSLGSWAGDMLGIPIVTVEFTRDASNFQPAEMWMLRQDAPGRHPVRRAGQAIRNG